jgi:sulfoxide reductase heme-binding subunit YedZ
MRSSMTVPMVAAVGHGSTALWYLTRATGLVSLVLLSATVVLGVVASVGWTTKRWPRFLSQSVHRNLSLFSLVLIGVHVVTTVADGYVPIGYLDAVIPFRTPYRPLWVGFGALAFDLLLAVAITSGLRRRIGTRAWRSVHWLAYVCWPIALLHGLGAGTDARLSLTLLIDVLCIVSVVGAVGWRLVTGRTFSPRRRIAAAIIGVTTLIGIGIVAIAGPLRPGWSQRAGTSTSVLAQLNTSFQSGSGTAAGTSSNTTAPSTGGVPSVPFSQSVQGTYQTSAPNQDGQVSVVLTMAASGSTGTPLVVKLNGASVNGGVAMSSSQVTWGPDTGTVTALQGSTIGAKVTGPKGSMDLTMQLNLDQATGTMTGTVSGTAGSTNGGGQ